MEQLMIQGFNAAGPLLMVSIQMLAINALLHNVEKFAYEAVRSPATKAFKVNPYQDKMMDYLFDAILMCCRPMKAGTPSMIAVVWRTDKAAINSQHAPPPNASRTVTARLPDSCR